MLTAVCATSTTMVGSASRKSVGRMGPVNSVARVASLRGRVRASRGAVAATVFPDGGCASGSSSGLIAL